MDDRSSQSTVRYAHPGHDRIARESQDLRQREDELRERWREMGFQLPQVLIICLCLKAKFLGLGLEIVRPWP